LTPNPATRSFRAQAPAAAGALLAWVQAEGDVNRVKALLQPLTSTPGQ